MKKINKSIVSLLTIVALGINSVFASGFPSEPMVIYGYTDGINLDNIQLEIYDGNNVLLKTVTASEWKYGTNKTFDLENKILLNQFDGDLIFKVWDSVLEPKDGLSNSCNGNTLFQAWKICEYNLFSDKQEDILDDMDNISEEEKSEKFNDIFSGKVVESTKVKITQEIWENVISTNTVTDEIIVVNKSVDVDSSVSKDLILISDTKKELVFIPKDTNTGNNDLVIEKPTKITSTSSIKSKINKDVFGAIEVPTNNQVNFDKYIRICLDTGLNSTSWVKVYASHDNNSWFYDTSARNLKIANSQICFDINHLTSFAVVKDVQRSSSWGGGKSRPYCEAKQLQCTQVWTKTYMRAIDESKCRVKDITETCNIETANDTTEALKTISETKNTLNNTSYKLTSKTYITWVRTFIKNKREIKQKYGLQVSYVKSDEEYNKTIDKLLKDINKNMKIQSIKQDMVKHIDTMSTSYAVSNDDTASDELRKIFKIKLENDIARVQQKLKVLKRKDYIVNKALTERKIRRAQQNANK